MEVFKRLAFLSSGLRPLDSLPEAHRSLYENVLERADRLLRGMEAKDHRLAQLDRPMAAEQGRESMDHRLLKRFIIYDHVANRGVDPGNIYVEGVDASGGSDTRNKFVPGVLVKGRESVAIDAKRSYGVLPPDELLEAVDKYSEYRVEVVFRPLPAILFLKGVWPLCRP